MTVVVVDRFTKMAHFIPMKKQASPTVARVYLENLWKYHGFPEDVVPDQDDTFTGQFFTDLYDYLGINKSMSTAYHPQSDSQTERINLIIDSYLRSYCNYEQNHLATRLAMADFDYNNPKHSSTNIAPFHANYGSEPQTNWRTEILFRNPDLELYCHYMSSVHLKLSKQLEQSIEVMRKYYDRKRKSIEPFKKGELVMLNGKNIWAKHCCKKLEDKMYGPFEVIATARNG